MCELEVCVCLCVCVVCGVCVCVCVCGVCVCVWCVCVCVCVVCVCVCLSVPHLHGVRRLLFPCNRNLLEKPEISLVYKSPACYGIRMLITLFTKSYR